jgi:broad specificity phosphatase PhoE
LSQCGPREFKERVTSHELARGALAVIFVRHGRSIANERETIVTDESLVAEFRAIPNHKFPLADVGIEQARATGRYLADMARQGLIPPIDNVIYSPFKRTQQTLGHVIEGAKEYCRENTVSLSEVFQHGEATRAEQWLGVRERSWANFQGLHPEKQEEEYEARVKEPFEWVPHGDRSGETIGDVSFRASEFLQAMHRPEFRGKVVLVITHGEFMNAAELVIRRQDPFSAGFRESFEKGIPNCGIMMVSRVAFSPQMTVPLASLAGFQQELRVVPYELYGSEEQKFSDWARPSWRQLIKETRTSLGDFRATPVEPHVEEFVEQARAKGIGQGVFTSKV